MELDWRRTLDVARLVLPVPLAIVELGVVPPATEKSDIVAVLAIAVLPLRRKLPISVLLVTLVGLSFSNLMVPVMVALLTVAARSGRYRDIALAGVGVAVVLGVHWPWLDPVDSIEIHDLRGLRVMVLRIVLMIGVPIALGLLIQARRESAGRLDELLRGRERENELIADTVLARERVHLAREMHDVVAHKVSLIAVQAGALQVSTPVKSVERWAETIRDLSVATLVELRHMVTVLRASGGGAEELAPQPRLVDIPALVGDSGIDADLTLDERVLSTEWPAPVERAAFRTVQEALTNVRKHAAGSAAQVAIRVIDGQLDVAVRNGPSDQRERPLDLPAGGHGLIGLRERAELMRGTFVARPTDDAGFLVHATFPTEV